jgi:hypothetical protein
VAALLAPLSGPYSLQVFEKAFGSKEKVDLSVIQSWLTNSIAPDLSTLPIARIYTSPKPSV